VSVYISYTLAGLGAAVQNSNGSNGSNGKVQRVEAAVAVVDDLSFPFGAAFEFEHNAGLSASAKEFTPGSAGSDGVSVPENSQKVSQTVSQKISAVLQY
jgi:hypothetical protein